MDRLLSIMLLCLAVALGCAAALLVLGGFIDYLIHDRWPDQSVLKIGYDSGLLRPRWFLPGGWSMEVHDVLARVPAALVCLLMAPACWWLGGVLGRR